jgi:hypothetical protein
MILMLTAVFINGDLNAPAVTVTDIPNEIFEGIGDILEDDVEHMYQISARIEVRVSHMRDKD